MKTTDSVMRELKELLDNKRSGLKESSDTNKTRQSILALFEDSLAEARREWVEEMRGKVENLSYALYTNNTPSITSAGKDYMIEKGTMLINRVQVLNLLTRDT